VAIYFCAEHRAQRARLRGDRLVDIMSEVRPPTVREPAQPDAEHPKRQLALAIVLEGLAATVRSVAIGLDRQPLVPPQEVDGEPADAHVHLGLREPVAAAQPQEGTLELGAGVVGGGISKVESPELGFADRLAKGRGRDGAFQVRDRPRRGRHRDAAANGRVARGQRGAVDAQATPFASATAGGRDRNVDRTLGRSEELPQLGRRSVAEDGAIAAGQNCCHALALLREPAVTDRVHATVNPVQPARGKATVDA
jgi:hypothetical protein